MCGSILAACEMLAFMCFSRNRTLTYFVGACTAATAFSTFTIAQTPSIEDTLVNAFVGNCVLNLPNLEKVRAASRIFGWKSLPPDVATMLGPIERRAQFEGWLASEETVQYIIGISMGSIGRQSVSSCSVANPQSKQHSLVDGLQKKLKLNPLTDDIEAGQRYRSWTTEANGYSVLITVTTMQNENSPGASLTAAVKLR